ncbi:MAG: nitrous oxide reductase family maturation protein NosD, partial [Candidatus Hodarchaeota archaeon]
MKNKNTSKVKTIKKLFFCFSFVLFLALIINFAGTPSSVNLYPQDDVKSSVSHPPIYLTDNSQLVNFTNNTGGNGTSWADAVILEDLEIDAGGGPFCIMINNTNRFLVIRNCTLRGATMAGGLGLVVTNCTNVNITNCTIENNNFVGLAIVQSNDTFVNDTIITGTTFYGFVSSVSNNVTVNDCTMSDNGDFGAVILATNNSLISGNMIGNNHYMGIYVDISENFTISNNNVTNNNLTGIQASNSKNLTLVGNNVSETNTTGINLDTCTDINITGNTIDYNHGNNGINVFTTSGCIIDNNSISYNTENGIYFYNADFNNITANDITGNTNGIFFTGLGLGTASNNNLVEENTIFANQLVGISLEFAVLNTFTFNNVFNNSLAEGLQIAGASVANIWNATLAGNYWGDYVSKYPLATQNQKIWDTPYHISYATFPLPATYDNLPLVDPVVPNSNAPSLTSGIVNPISGDQNTPLNFSVMYTDADNNYPIYINTVIDGVPYEMEKVNPADVDYTDGCMYQLITYLQTGSSHNFSFQCADTRYTNNTSTTTGLNIGYSNLAAPVLSNGDVFPSSGYNGTTVFEFTVEYSDTDNNNPSYVNMTVNNGTNTSTFQMSKQDPSDLNYMDGCIYLYSTTLDNLGSYTYWFNTSDGISSDASLGPFSGLSVENATNFVGNLSNYTWTGEVYYGESPTAINSSEFYLDTGGGSFTVISGFLGRTIEGLTREITASDNTEILKLGTHEPMIIFPNVELGSKVLIA